MRPSSAPAPKRGPRSSRTSRSSIIGSACTQPWAIALQPKPGPAWRRSRCARQHDILIAFLHSQGGSPHCHTCCPFPGATKGGTSMQRGPDCLSGSQTTAGLVSLDAFARSKDATPSPPRSSHFHPWWCTPRVLLGCLGIGEGVESVLSLHSLPEFGSSPVWSLIFSGGGRSSSGLAGFPVLPGIESLWIAVDHDANGAGQRAARTAAHRWRQAGREVFLVTP